MGAAVLVRTRPANAPGSPWRTSRSTGRPAHSPAPLQCTGNTDGKGSHISGTSRTPTTGGTDMRSAPAARRAPHPGIHQHDESTPAILPEVDQTGDHQQHRFRESRVDGRNVPRRAPPSMAMPAPAVPHRPHSPTGPARRLHRLDLQHHVTQGELSASDVRDQFLDLGDVVLVILPGDVPCPVGHVGTARKGT